MCETQSIGVDWLKISDIFLANEIPQRSIDLVDSANASKYSWIDYKI